MREYSGSSVSVQHCCVCTACYNCHAVETQHATLFSTATKSCPRYKRVTWSTWRRYTDSGGNPSRFITFPGVNEQRPSWEIANSRLPPKWAVHRPSVHRTSVSRQARETRATARRLYVLHVYEPQELLRETSRRSLSC